MAKTDLTKLQEVSNKYQEGNLLIPLSMGHYSITSFPQSIHPSIKDYIDCHFKLMTFDNFSIQFKLL